MATLKSQLEEYLASFKSKAPLEAQDTMNSATADLKRSGIEDRALQEGQHAPDFRLSDQNGQQRSLGEFLERGSVVLTFYRGGWCPFCNLALAGMQAALEEIHAAGAQLLAVTPELPDSSLTTQERHGLEFTIMSDVGNTVAEEYGLVFTVPAELRPIYADFGIDIPSHNGDQTFRLPVPATFVIDGDGIVRYRFADADYTKRAEPQEVVAALQGAAV